MEEKFTLTLSFPSEEQRRYFIGQLIDGFGENHADYSWAGKAENKPLPDDATELSVDVTNTELWEHKLRCDRYLRSLGFER